MITSENPIDRQLVLTKGSPPRRIGVGDTPAPVYPRSSSNSVEKLADFVNCPRDDNTISPRPVVAAFRRRRGGPPNSALRDRGGGKLARQVDRESRFQKGKEVNCSEPRSSPPDTPLQIAWRTKGPWRGQGRVPCRLPWCVKKRLEDRARDLRAANARRPVSLNRDRNEMPAGDRARPRKCKGSIDFFRPIVSGPPPSVLPSRRRGPLMARLISALVTADCRRM